MSKERMISPEMQSIFPGCFKTSGSSMMHAVTRLRISGQGCLLKPKRVTSASRCVFFLVKMTLTFVVLRKSFVINKQENSCLVNSVFFAKSETCFLKYFFIC